MSAAHTRAEPAMQLHRSSTAPTCAPPEDTFTGNVQISGHFRREAPSRLAGAVVTFAPGARTPWKVNPLGQTLIVISGVGWAQSVGEAITEIRAGDVIWCPPGQRHWEGATPDQAMTYVALHEGTVQFTGRVTNEEYRMPHGSTPRRHETGANNGVFGIDPRPPLAIGFHTNST